MVNGLMFLGCFLVSISLVVVGILLLGMRIGTQRQKRQQQLATRIEGLSHVGLLAAFARQIDDWVAQGRLTQEVSANLRELIEQDRGAATTRYAAPVPASAAGTLVATEPVAAPMATSATAPATATLPQHIPPGTRIRATLGALYTRRTLLYLGAFLLVMSALTMVIFNWASFPPIVQFGLLAGVTGVLWLTGDWLVRKTDLQQAGANLRVVAALLVPLVALALARPGLLDLAPRQAWLLCAIVSSAVYLPAAWLIRRSFYSGAGAVALANALLAALTMLPNQWLLPVAALLLTGYLLLIPWLRRTAAELVSGVFWIAHVALPVTLFTAALLWLSGLVTDMSPALTCWIGASFYVAAAIIDRQPRWIWPAAALPPVALITTLVVWQTDLYVYATALAWMALVYLIVALLLEREYRAYSMPAYVGSLVLVLLAGLGSFENEQTARLVLPPLILCGVTTVVALQHGALSRLRPNLRTAVALGAFAGIAVLLPVWLGLLLDLSTLADTDIALMLLPLAGLYYAGARWWPGQLRPGFDLTLQIVATLLALAMGSQALIDPDTRMLAAGLLTITWIGQALLRPQPEWAGMALASTLLTGHMWLSLVEGIIWLRALIGLNLGYTLVYALGGSMLRHTRWRYWTAPALGWSGLTALLILFLVALDLGSSAELSPLALQVGALLALAGLSAILGILWRRSWSGYATALLVIAGTLLAATDGFFTAWQPDLADYASVMSFLALALWLLGQGLRRLSLPFAYPYQVAGLALVVFAPLPATGVSPQMTFAWGMIAVLYALTTWRNNLAWALVPAFVALDLTMLHAMAWLFPGGRPAGAALILLVATWFQAIWGLAAGRLALPEMQRRPAYLAALLSAVGTLLLASGDNMIFCVAAGLLALLAAIVASLERNAGVAWGALALALVAAFRARLTLVPGLDFTWTLAWIQIDLLIIALLGWLVEVKTPWPELGAVWRRPTTSGPVVVGGAAVLVLALRLTGLAVPLPPLTFSLATLALLLATVSVRERQIWYAYAAGACIVGAAACQLFDWGLRELQWYVIPAGVYLLALAAGLRRFQGQARASQVVEAGAVLLILGTSLGQSLQAGGNDWFGYALWLCGESLLMLGYGVLLRLRVPFIGGIAFFVLGVLWMSANALKVTNQWIVFGILGLLMVAAYVLLERQQERLRRMGRAWIAELQQWQ